MVSKVRSPLLHFIWLYSVTLCLYFAHFFFHFIVISKWGFFSLQVRNLTHWTPPNFPVSFSGNTHTFLWQYLWDPRADTETVGSGKGIYLGEKKVQSSRWWLAEAVVERMGGGVVIVAELEVAHSLGKTKRRQHIRVKCPLDVSLGRFFSQRFTTWKSECREHQCCYAVAD